MLGSRTRRRNDDIDQYCPSHGYSCPPRCELRQSYDGYDDDDNYEGDEREDEGCGLEEQSEPKNAHIVDEHAATSDKLFAKFSKCWKQTHFLIQMIYEDKHASLDK
jgi:hypothetical protein